MLYHFISGFQEFLKMTSNIPIGEAKPPFLSGRYTNSFAFPTLKDRVPTIVCKVIDLLHRQRRFIEQDHEQNSLKGCIEKMVSFYNHVRAPTTSVRI